MITPREMLRDYMTVLNILMQNPAAGFADIVGTIPLAAAAETAEIGEASPAPSASTVTMEDLEF